VDVAECSCVRRSWDRRAGVGCPDSRRQRLGITTYHACPQRGVRPMVLDTRPSSRTAGRSCTRDSTVISFSRMSSVTRRADFSTAVVRDREARRSPWWRHRSGKSTCSTSLLRSLTKAGPDSARRPRYRRSHHGVAADQVSKLAQFPFFVKDTIRENIRLQTGCQRR